MSEAWRLWVAGAVMRQEAGRDQNLFPMTWIGLARTRQEATGLCVTWMQETHPRAQIMTAIDPKAIPDDMVAVAYGKGAAP